MVKNDAGEVAVTFYQNVQHYQLLGNKHEYVFLSKNKYVSIAWVKPEDVPALLEIKHACCPGSNPKPSYRLSSQQEVNLWSGTGNPRG